MQSTASGILHLEAILSLSIEKGSKAGIFNFLTQTLQPPTEINLIGVSNKFDTLSAEATEIPE